MLTEEEKKIIEKLIQFHKNADGTVYPDIKPSFNAFLGVGYINTHPLIDKCVTLDLIKYKFPDRTGWTMLTKKGWEFTTFENFDNMQLSQKEIDRITIDKLKADLINSTTRRATTCSSPPRAGAPTSTIAACACPSARS